MSKTQLYYACIHLRFIKVSITSEPNMIGTWSIHQSTSFAESQKAQEAHGCKPWVTKLPIIPYTLAIVTAHITDCIKLLEYVYESQVNACTVQYHSTPFFSLNPSWVINTLHCNPSQVKMDKSHMEYLAETIKSLGDGTSSYHLHIVCKTNLKCDWANIRFVPWEHIWYTLLHNLDWF